MEQSVLQSSDGPATILVVDDEDQIRESLSEFLEDAGHKTLSAKNALTALKAIAEGNPDLVILDLLMPGKDGFHVLKNLGDRLESLPVVVISGTGRIEHVVQALKMGAWDFITKPITGFEVVGHAVNRALERSRLIRENAAYQKHLEELVEQRTRELEKEIEQRKKIEHRLRENEQRFKDLSRRDDLTGLFNSRHFHTQIQDEVERSDRYGRPLSLIFLDLDDFKHYNDSYGHLQGDIVLETLGRAIEKYIRHLDSAYRYGGEEFVIILPETDLDSAHAVAERLRQNFARIAFNPEARTVEHMTVSLGVVARRPGETKEDFLRRADQAMYRAKKMGKNTTIVEK
jgi:diguanylate cyclase (GGDEF)-like protein